MNNSNLVKKSVNYYALCDSLLFVYPWACCFSMIFLLNKIVVFNPFEFDYQKFECISMYLTQWDSSFFVMVMLSFLTTEICIPSLLIFMFASHYPKLKLSLVSIFVLAAMTYAYLIYEVGRDTNMLSEFVVPFFIANFYFLSRRDESHTISYTLVKAFPENRFSRWLFRPDQPPSLLFNGYALGDIFLFMPLGCLFIASYLWSNNVGGPLILSWERAETAFMEFFQWNDHNKIRIIPYYAILIGITCPLLFLTIFTCSHKYMRVVFLCFLSIFIYVVVQQMLSVSYTYESALFYATVLTSGCSLIYYLLLSRRLWGFTKLMRKIWNFDFSHS